MLPATRLRLRAELLPEVGTRWHWGHFLGGGTFVPQIRQSPVLGMGVSGTALAAIGAPRGSLPLHLLRRVQCFKVSGLSWPRKSRGTSQRELLPELLPETCQLADTGGHQPAPEAR